MQARPVLLIPHALPIPGTAVLVEYEGAITEVSDTPADYTVRDRIAKRVHLHRSFGHLGAHCVAP